MAKAKTSKTTKSKKETKLPKEKKPVEKERPVEILEKKAPKKPKEKRYYEAVGRRKTAVARVRLFTSGPLQSTTEGNLIINDKSYKDFFSIPELQGIVEAPLKRLKSLNRFRATIKVKGGGIRGQAEAICHGIARTLVMFDPNFRKRLKKAGYLTRDPRKKERKKFGLKKARRAPQWQKR